MLSCFAFLIIKHRWTIKEHHIFEKCSSQVKKKICIVKEANINKGTQTRLYRKYITPTKLPSNTKFRARKDNKVGRERPEKKKNEMLAKI